MLLHHIVEKWTKIHSDDLLPGDLISIVRGTVQSSYGGGASVPCDVLLLDGTVVVDESMLTGESLPQMKESIETRDTSDVLQVKNDKLHILYAGTNVIQQTPNSRKLKGMVG